jgi:uncharacterized membrane protein YgaE (UPF0421/DUF939 family)
MFIVTQNDNSDARLAHLEQQVAELRAEIAALKAANEPTDRKAYMKNYMARRRAEEKAKRQEAQG